MSLTVSSLSFQRSFTLILQALDFNNYTSPGKSGTMEKSVANVIGNLVNASVSVSASNSIIEETGFSAIIDPSAEWHMFHHPGRTAQITYRVRVKCEVHNYNRTCTKFCRPRDDKFGHYICDKNGDKKCIDGWKGDNCDVGESRCHTRSLISRLWSFLRVEDKIICQ